jgi:hypothetical protein
VGHAPTSILNLFFVGEGPPQWLAAGALASRPAVALLAGPGAPQPSLNENVVILGCIYRPVTPLCNEWDTDVVSNAKCSLCHTLFFLLPRRGPRSSLALLAGAAAAVNIFTFLNLIIRYPPNNKRKMERVCT